MPRQTNNIATLCDSLGYIKSLSRHAARSFAYMNLENIGISMAMEILSIDDDGRAWNAFVESRSEATLYHRFEWRRVVRGSFGHVCPYLAAVDSRGTWQGILPLVHMRSALFGNFLISMPFFNYGGLLCNNESAREALLRAAEALRISCGASHVEFRHVARQKDALPARQHKVSMILALETSARGQWAKFDPKLRNQIRKSEKSSLIFRMGGDELLGDFYNVFARNMRDLGTPVYSREFFRNVLGVFPDSTRLAVVYRNGVAIAGGLTIHFRSRIEIPWASSVREFNNLCPNHLLYWNLLQFAIAHGVTEFDFGRSTPHEGTYNFKKQWGAIPQQLNWEYLLGDAPMPELNPTNPKYQLAIRAWRKLPVPVTKWLGPQIVRNIP